MKEVILFLLQGIALSRAVDLTPGQAHLSIYSDFDHDHGAFALTYVAHKVRNMVVDD